MVGTGQTSCHLPVAHRDRQLEKPLGREGAGQISRERAAHGPLTYNMLIAPEAKV